ncbi:MAG: prepilin-type N-terminal cleavage/methylation domain-containing protein [Candidatus Omnitrophica bacterium]|nr:prepilin-type N-terminal cleavage/methylation domain-containing protein [Candidatus Omnitrophota bacterium]
MKNPFYKTKGFFSPSSGLTLLEMMVVLAIITFILAIAGHEYIDAGRRARRKVCLFNLKRLDDAKKMWAMDKGEGRGSRPDWSDLVTGYIRKAPYCPSGGTYYLGSMEEDASCSYKGHDW